ARRRSRDRNRRRGTGHVGPVHPHPPVPAVRLDQGGRIRHRRFRGPDPDRRDGRAAGGRKPRRRGHPLHHLSARSPDTIPCNLTDERMNAQTRLEAIPKLLIVEDDEGLQRQLRWAYDDYEVLVASDRNTAIDLLRAQEPPVVTLDLGLPPDPDGVTEGFAALETILTLKPETKVIVASGHGARESALRAIASGAY